MLNWLNPFGSRVRLKTIPEELWLNTLLAYPFLAQRPVAEHARLRSLVIEFLKKKEFSGAHGLKVTDEMAVAIAAQACLPVLHLGLHWYNDFKGIVVHPGAMVAKRVVTDMAGVVHRYKEVLQGEAMQGGPVTLSWQDVAESGSANSTDVGYNLVIHEFVHKIDMRDGQADGCPPLLTKRQLSEWHEVMQPAYDAFCEQVAMHQRFGGAAPWLDAYATTSPAEFFAVASEAYFVNRQRFTQDFAPLTVLFDSFYIRQ